MKEQSRADIAAAGPRDELSTAMGLHRSGRLGEAEAVYGRILERQPRHAEALNLLGVLHAQRRDFERARALLEASVRERPSDGRFHANLARALAGAGAEADAVAAYRNALKLNPHDAQAAMDLGGLLIRMDLVEEAAACFQRVTEIQPNHAAAFEGLGFAEMRRRRTDAAITAFGCAAALLPEDPAGQSNLGGLFLETGRVEEAVASFRRAVALAPHDAALHSNLGAALYAAGKPEAALEAYEACLRLSPRDVRALSAKGTVLDELGRDADARAIFDYDRLIRVTAALVPPAYDDIQHFNQELSATVSAHPSLMADRPGKTTRLGSQTANLWQDKAVPLAALRGLIQHALADYLADESLSGHPYAPERPARHRLVVWATILNSGGHQDPHNHPGGAVSGVYYARVPAVIGDDDSSNQGWLEFGRPNRKFGALEPKILRRVRPEEGRFVLFPSHFWHRTLPFASDEQRISIAFDLVPL